MRRLRVTKDSGQQKEKRRRTSNCDAAAADGRCEKDNSE